MRKTFRQTLQTMMVATGFALFIAAPVMTTITPQPAAAAVCNEDRVLGIPPWFRGLVKEDGNQCVVIEPAAVGGLQQFIWKIVLNIIDMALVIVGYIAVFFILFGGFQFITGGSSPDQVSKARKTILNAVIGLTIALASIGIVNLIFRAF